MYHSNREDHLTTAAFYTIVVRQDIFLPPQSLVQVKSGKPRTSRLSIINHSISQMTQRRN